MPYFITFIEGMLLAVIILLAVFSLSLTIIAFYGGLKIRSVIFFAATLSLVSCIVFHIKYPSPLFCDCCNNNHSKTIIHDINENIYYDINEDICTNCNHKVVLEEFKSDSNFNEKDFCCPECETIIKQISENSLKNKDDILE